MNISREDKIRETVRKHYGEVAKTNRGCCSSSCCSTSNASDLSVRIGYSTGELATVPSGAEMGLGCGNPQTIAGLKKGEVVMDLGSGGGVDCFLAARKVGPKGHVIGVDMTPDMVSKARAAAEQGDYENVEFRLGEIEHIPMADNSVDVIISNCVINLSPYKSQVFREAFRVLRVGGRIAISDVVATREMPESIKTDLNKYAGCVSGAVLVSDIEEMLEAAGFSKIKISCKEESREFIKDWFPGSGVEAYVVSANIEAKKISGKKARVMDTIVDERIKELIAIGTSIGLHCYPCLSYHVAKAKDLVIEEKDIREAIAVGHIVEKGAMSTMRKYSEGILEKAAVTKINCC